ncbi:MAG: glycoside hydrolase family 127 protein [Phycisphaerae bacterium]|nr:glycoside hydrolase family 127 protein [Phycisphaerae bacterium]
MTRVLMMSVISGMVGSMAFAAGAHRVQFLDLKFPTKVEAKGDTLTHLQRAYGRLCSPPLSDIEFVLSDVNFKLNRRFTNYSGDISGRMLGALDACDLILGKKTDFVDELLAGFKKYQKPDGHFGADQDLDKEVTQLRDMAILWGNGRQLLALSERLRTQPDPEIRSMAIRLGDYMISTRKYYGKEENFKGVGGIKASGFTTCYPSLIDGLAALGEVTGEKRFVDEASFIAKLSLIDKGFDGHHSHGRLTAYRGMLDINRITKSDRFRMPVVEGRLEILEKYMVPTGGVTEYFDLHYDRDEGCSEGDWLRVNLFSWRDSGESGCLDVAEHVLRNHIHAMQFSNGGSGHYLFRALKDGDAKLWYGGVANLGSESYWCCSMHIAQALAEVTDWGVVAHGNRILVTWLAEVAATIRPPGQEHDITVTTTRTGRSTWTVKVDAPNPVEASLALRVPRSDHAITIDGKTVRGRGSWADFTGEGGWATVTQKWSGSTTLKIELSEDITLDAPYEKGAKEGGPVCVLAAGDLYCLPDAWRVEDLVAPEAIPSIVMAAKKPTKGRIPVVIEGAGGKTQRVDLVPMETRPAGGAVWVFKVRRVDESAFKELAAKAAPTPKPGVPVELEFGIEGEFELYLNGKFVRRHGGCGECPQIDAYTNRPANVLAIKARSKAKKPALIGMLRVAGQKAVTLADGKWTVARVGDQVPGDLLTDAKKGCTDEVKVVDVGPFGMPPYDYIAAENLHTGARWIWAEGKFDASKGWWLFRIPFDVPEAAIKEATR